jgi:hypothetical protein
MPPTDDIVGYDLRADGIDYTVCAGECSDDERFGGCEFEPIRRSQAGDSFCELCDVPLAFVEV